MGLRESDGSIRQMNAMIGMDGSPFSELLGTPNVFASREHSRAAGGVGGRGVGPGRSSDSRL